MNLLEHILFALWFFAPAGFANAAPIFANNISALKNFTAPLDFGKTLRGKRIFGNHKTFRGLLSGIFLGTVVIFVQYLIYKYWALASGGGWFPERLSDVNYGSLQILLMGAAMGAGALIGDAIKSFFKRQIGVKPGASWVPFDQVDFIIGGLIFTSPFVSFSLATYISIFLVMALLHPVINLLGWMLHLKEKPF